MNIPEFYIAAIDNSTPQLSFPSAVYKKIIFQTFPSKGDHIEILNGFYEITNITHRVSSKELSCHTVAWITAGDTELDLAISDGWLSHDEYIKECEL